MTGWHDFMLRELLADYDRLVEAGRRPHLTVGPWYHADARYLTEAVRFALGPEELAGLERFLGLAAEEGLLAGERKHPEPLVIAGEPDFVVEPDFAELPAPGDQG